MKSDTQTRLSHSFDRTVIFHYNVLFQHFVCAKCEKPFHGHRHYEKKGLAYCEQHYHQLFGNLCYVCNQVIAGDGKWYRKYLLIL